jgi:hypothetical protein
MLVCKAMMVSQPKHPFWEAVFRALLEQVPRLKAARAGGEDLSPVDTTGPVLLTKIFEKHPDAFMDVMVYPSNVFYPCVRSCSAAIECSFFLAAHARPLHCV